MKRVTLVVLALSCMVVGTASLAAVSGIGSVATTVASNLAAVARLITAASYVEGMAFAVGAIVKFKAHKDNPTQIPIGTPIALMFIAGALLFLPSILGVAGATMFGAGAEVGSPTGTVFTGS